MSRLLATLALATVAAAWSVTITVVNQAPYEMYLLVANNTRGSWVTTPSNTLMAGYQNSFELDGGSLGSTSGRLIYSVAQGGPQVALLWDVGATASYQTVAIPPNYISYTTGSDSHGKTVTFSIVQRYSEVAQVKNTTA